MRWPIGKITQHWYSRTNESTHLESLDLLRIVVVVLALFRQFIGVFGIDIDIDRIICPASAMSPPLFILALMPIFLMPSPHFRFQYTLDPPLALALHPSKPINNS